MQLRHPFADGQTVYVFDIDVIPLLDRTKMIAKLPQVAGVIAERVRAHTPLVREVFEELIDEVLKHPKGKSYALGVKPRELGST